MAKQSVLDEAIEKVKPDPPTSKIDRILAELTDCDDFDRLIDMLTAPLTEWPHKPMAGIIRHLCDHYGVNHENVTGKNVGDWRSKQSQQ